MLPQTQRFAPELRSVGAARRYAVQVLAGSGVRHGLLALQDDLRTVVSELATNAVLHARTDYTVTLDVDEASVRISVGDGSPVLPRLRMFGGSDSSTGRGLHMIAAVSTAWGTTPTGDGGKVTWCELTVPVGSA